MALISDQGSNFAQSVNNLNISPERPYFLAADEKIYIFFDTPHLVKSLRNNLFKYKFKVNNEEFKKCFIGDFYSRDKKLSIRQAPKMTDTHLNPTNSENEGKISSPVI